MGKDRIDFGSIDSVGFTFKYLNKHKLDDSNDAEYNNGKPDAHQGQTNWIERVAHEFVAFSKMDFDIRAAVTLLGHRFPGRQRAVLVR